MAKRRTAANIIAFHFGCDISEISESRYQPSRYSSPAVYVVGDDYYAAPSNNKPPKYCVGEPWVEVAEWYGRKIFRAAMDARGLEIREKNDG